MRKSIGVYKSRYSECEASAEPKFIFIILFFVFLFLSQNQLIAEISFQPIIKSSELQGQEKELLLNINNTEDIESLYKLAEFYAHHRYYPKAIELLEQITVTTPHHHQSYFLLGRLLGSQKTDPNGSISALQSAIELQPENIEYREEIVNVYHRLQRFPPALEQLEVILQLEPDNQDALYRKAVILYTQGNVDDASNLVAQLPNHEHAQVLNALIHLQTGNDAQALFESVIDRFPENIRARYELGKIWMKQKKWELAQTLFENIIDEDPFYQHALFQLVKLYSLQKQKEKAQLAKQSLDVINRMGRDQRNFYRSYLQHHPDTTETHFSMAMMYLEIGRGDLAAAEFHETIERDHDHKDAHFYLAQIYMSSGEFQKAILFLEKCVQLHENKAVMHSLLAQCYLELKNAYKAKDHLDKALKLNPNDSLGLRIHQLLQNRQNEIVE